MIEDEVRLAFERHEHLVPDGARLRPVIEAQARRRRRLRASAGAALAVLAAALAVPAAVQWQPAPPPARPADTPMTFLVAGLDATDETARADTVLLAHVPADRSRLYLVSLPRDLFVDVPGHGRAKLGHSHALGGFPLLAATVSDLTGVSLDGAAAVNFDGMLALVDAVGGVRVCVDHTVTSIHTGRTYPNGCRQFNAAEALDFLRQRMGYPEGALQRDRYQIRFAKALLAKLGPADLPALVAMAGKNLVVDTRERTLVEVFDEVRPALREVVGVALPVGGLAGSVQIDGQVGFPVTGDARELFAAIRTDDLASWLARHPAARS